MLHTVAAVRDNEAVPAPQAFHGTAAGNFTLRESKLGEGYERSKFARHPRIAEQKPPGGAPWGHPEKVLQKRVLGRGLGYSCQFALQEEGEALEAERIIMRQKIACEGLKELDKGVWILAPPRIMYLGACLSLWGLLGSCPCTYQVS